MTIRLDDFNLYPIQTIYEYEKEGLSSIERLTDLRYTVRLMSSLHRCGGEIKELRAWSGLRFDRLMYRDWFFRYVASLHQVQNPRGHFYLSYTRNLLPKSETEIAIRALKNKITRAKADVTRMENEIGRAKQVRAEKGFLFGIETDPNYEKFISKLTNYKNRQQALEAELHALVSASTPNMK